MFLFVCLFGIPTIASAQVMMTEVMYDLEGTDTGREWIEIYNAGSSGVDLGDWKLFEANTNHRLTAQSASVIPPQGFAVIADNTAKFLADNPSFSGVLFDSTFSLSNEGETLVLRDGSGVDVDTVSYTSALGANGDGRSLQKSGMSWVSALPTLSALTSTGVSQSSGPTTSGGTESVESVSSQSGQSSSHSGQSSTSGLGDDVILEVSSGRDRLGFVGTPLSFEAKVKKPRDLASVSVAHSWSMGDGTRKSGQFISHTYVYPGDYVVILNSEHGGDKAVSKVRVHVVSPQVSIRAINQEFIEIGNDGNDELNLGGWAIEAEGARFVIPQDTVVLSHSAIKFHSGITRLRPERAVHLINPSLAVIVGKDVVGGTSHVVVRNGEEPVVAMEGLTEAVIRERLAIASTVQHIGISDVSENVAVTLSKKTSDSKESVALATTSTQSASVIYTVGKNSPSRGLFRRMIDFFLR